jgi:hypothetical protein
VEGNDPWRVELTDELKWRAVDEVFARRAIAETFADRLARPEERNEVGLRIDPTTANVFILVRPVRDPYDDYPDDPDRGGGREVSFAADPQERVGVALFDLLDETREALAEKEAAAWGELRRRLWELVRPELANRPKHPRKHGA